MLIYPLSCSEAINTAVKKLMQYRFSFIDHPSPEVTHLLLDVPSFSAPPLLRCGVNLQEILETLPESVKIIGGGLNVPFLQKYSRTDLLEDAYYLAENAAITAECAIRVAGSKLRSTFANLPVLIIGWGRIGKCLAQKLAAMNSDVWILIRKESERAMAHALGYQTVSLGELEQKLPSFRILFNTAPAAVISGQMAQSCRNCLKIDLASVPGIDAEDVIHARGLPGLMAPQSSGTCIADAIMRLEGKL